MASTTEAAAAAAAISQYSCHSNATRIRLVVSQLRTAKDGADTGQEDIQYEAHNVPWLLDLGYPLVGELGRLDLTLDRHACCALALDLHREWVGEWVAIRARKRRRSRPRAIAAAGVDVAAATTVGEGVNAMMLSHQPAEGTSLCLSHPSPDKTNLVFHMEEIHKYLHTTAHSTRQYVEVLLGYCLNVSACLCEHTARYTLKYLLRTAAVLELRRSAFVVETLVAVVEAAGCECSVLRRLGRPSTG